MNYSNEIPIELQQKLHGLSIDEALSHGLIFDIGDEAGNFLFENEDVPGTFYVIINDYIIRCSNKLINQYSLDEIENDVMGDLTFFSYSRKGEMHFIVGGPKYLNLGKPLLKLKPIEENETLPFIQLRPLMKPPHKPKKGIV